MKNRRVRIVWVETLHNDIPFAGYILSLPFQNATSKPQESSTHSNQNFNLLSPQHPLFSFVLNMTALVKITCWVDHSNLSRKSFSISEEANFSRLEDPVGWGVCSSDDLMLPHQLQSNSLSRYWYIPPFFRGKIWDESRRCFTNWQTGGTQALCKHRKRSCFIVFHTDSDNCREMYDNPTLLQFNRDSDKCLQDHWDGDCDASEVHQRHARGQAQSDDQASVSWSCENLTRWMFG